MVFYSPADGGGTIIQESMAPLAALIFNERKAEIIPALAGLKNCNKNLTIPWTCSSGGNPRVIFQYVVELAQLSDFPNAIIGPVESIEAQAVGMGAAVFGYTPIMSNWATSPLLANPQIFPTFARTIPSDTAGADNAAELAQRLGYSMVALIYENSDFGTGFKDALFASLSARNIQLKFSAYTTLDQTTMEQAFQSIRETMLNLVFLVTNQVDLPMLASAWYIPNDQQEFLFIFLSLDSIYSTVQLAASYNGTDDALSKMFDGSLSFTYSVKPNPQFSNFLKLMGENEFVQYESGINKFFPPNGNATSITSCANSNISYQLYPGQLNASALYFTSDIWAYTFDAVITMGLAICSLIPQDPLPTVLDDAFGQALHNASVYQNFDGLSGNVRFITATGDRDPRSADYILTNFIRTGSFELTSNAVGVWAGVNWTYNLTGMYFKTGKFGVLPSETVLPIQNFNYLPNSLKYLGYFEVAFLNTICLICILWVWINRATRVVINAQGSLLMLMIIGCSVASWSILALTIDDAPDETLNANIGCMAAPILFSFGFELALVALIAKIMRIYVLFKSSSKMKKRRVAIHHVMGLIALFMSGEVIILILWTSLDPLTYQRFVTQTDEFNNPTDSVGECYGDSVSFGFVAIVFTLHALSVIFTGIASSFVKDFPVQYQESRYLNLAVLSMGQIYILAVPSVIAVYSSSIGRFVMTSTVVLISALALLCFLIVPKMFPKQFSMHTATVEVEGGSPKKNRIVTNGGAGSGFHNKISKDGMVTGSIE